MTNKINQVGTGATKTLSDTSKNVGNTAGDTVNNAKNTADSAVCNLSNTARDTGGAISRGDLKGTGKALAKGMFRLHLSSN